MANNINIFHAIYGEVKEPKLILDTNGPWYADLHMGKSFYQIRASINIAKQTYEVALHFRREGLVDEQAGTQSIMAGKALTGDWWFDGDMRLLSDYRRQSHTRMAALDDFHKRISQRITNGYSFYTMRCHPDYAGNVIRDVKSMLGEDYSDALS